MILNTKYFGEIEFDQADAVRFEHGILGFEGENSFAVLDLFENKSFTCLQSTEDTNVAFILVKPWDFFRDYQISISKEVLEDLNIEDEKQVAIYNILSVQTSLKDATANLLAPIVINVDKRHGKQYVLREESYTTRHRIFPQEKV